MGNIKRPGSRGNMGPPDEEEEDFTSTARFIVRKFIPFVALLRQRGLDPNSHVTHIAKGER